MIEFTIGMIKWGAGRVKNEDIDYCSLAIKYQ